MTTNGKGNVANFTDVVYDPTNDTSTGRKRIAISATEIELLDDIPPMIGSNVTTLTNNGTNQTRDYDTKIISSLNSRQTQQNTYQSLSLNNRSTKPNIIYHDENDPQMNSAFDKLIEKYAPDANPANLLNNSNTHRMPPPPPPPSSSSSTAPQINARTTYDETGFSTFQTSSTLPSSTNSHNYSTINRANNNQTSQNSIPTNANNFSSSIHSKSTNNYDSFQHVPSQQWQSTPKQQQQQSQSSSQQHQSQFQNSIRIQTKNGNLAQVVPGKLYDFHDDPLHLFFDRQNPNPSTQQQFTSSFQPSIHISTVTNPLTAIYTNTTQQFQSQSPPITTNSNFIPSVNGMAPLDLGILIKRVQQDYLREIQPFVSSVKFVEKDQEYGQNLSDIGFTTSTTVGKGFRRQADDILRRSFNQQNRTQPTKHYDDDDDNDNTYTDSNSETYADDISDLPSLNQNEKIKQKISKQSTSSMTSVTTNDTEYDDEFLTENNQKKKTVASKGTSPPPQRNSAQSQSITRTTSSNDDNENDETTTVTPLITNTKQARRLSSSDKSASSSDTHATYSDKESIDNKNHTNSISTIPMTKSNNETIRTQTNISNSQVIQRTDDIRPTPPITHHEQLKRNNSETELSSSNSAATNDDDDDDDKPAVYNEQLQISSANRSDLPSTGMSNIRTTPITNSRNTMGNNPSTTITAARTAAENMRNQPANSNIHFLSADQRTAVNQRSGQSPPAITTTTTTGPTQTGSTRFFQTDNDSKSNTKRTLKDVPSTIGNKIKSIFRRK